MKEKHNLALTKEEVKQLFSDLLLVEDIKFTKKPTKKFWQRHENILRKLQVIIYDSNNTEINKTKQNKSHNK